MPVNDLIADDVVRHAHWVERFKGSASRRMFDLLKAVDDDIVKTLRDGLPEGYKRRRLERIMVEVKTMHAEATAAFETGLQNDLIDYADYEADFMARIVERRVPVGIEMARPTPAALEGIVKSLPFQGRHLKEWAKSIDAASVNAIDQSLRIGLVEGQTVDQMVRRVRGTRRLAYKDGILPGMRRRHAEAVVRTAVQHTQARTLDRLFQANQDIVKGVQWVSTLDTRTTEVCMQRDGRVFPLKSGPRPPAHVNCRSVIVPITKSWRELGFDRDELLPDVRASMTGRAPGRITYDQWLRRQSAAVQDEALGPKRGRLFRAGVPVGRFASRYDGERFSLSELKTQEKHAWNAAGLG